MRRLSAVDAAAMADIHARSFERGWEALEMSAHCAKDECYGLGTPLAAFIILRIVGKQAEVLTLATDPDRRRAGLGRDLLVASIGAMVETGVAEIFLEVAEDNIAALALYRACGFQAMGQRPGYYRRAGGRMAALTFCKKLDDAGAAA